LVWTPAGARAQGEGPRLVARIPTQAPRDQQTGTDGIAILNSSTRRFYEILDTNRTVGGSRLQSFDLDTFKPLRTIPLPVSLFPVDTGFAGIPYAVDEKGGRLFFPYYNKALSDLALGSASGVAGVLIVNEKTGGVTNQQMPSHVWASGVASPRGASWSQPEGRLYIIGRTVLPKLGGSDFESNFVQEGGISSLPSNIVVRWNPEKNAAQAAADPLGYAEAIRPVRACRRGLPNELVFGRFQAVVQSSAFEPSVWVACSTATLGFQMVRLDRNQLADPQGTEEVYPGPERIRSTLADPVSDRFFARYVSGGEVWWVFDGRKRAWVGRIGGNTATVTEMSAGLDTGTGRLYLYYPGAGLLRSDARRQEVPQADRFAQVARNGPAVPLLIDAMTRHVFVRGAADRYDVWLDDPVIEEPPPDNPDSRTTDVDEGEGATGVGFAAVARSYGSRLLLIGGAFGITPTDQFGSGRGLLLATGTSCGAREREVDIGLVEDTNLGSSQASARSHALKTDDATKQDLGSPSRCDLNPNGALRPPVLGNYYPGLGALPDPQPQPGRQSTFAGFVDREARRSVDPDTVLISADCSGDQGARLRAPRQPLASDIGAPQPLAQALAGVPLHDLKAQVDCEQSKERASASAGGPVVEIQQSSPSEFPAVKIAHATSQTNEFRDNRRGVVSLSYAIARGISIGDTPSGPLVSIDAVESWAEAAANGRKRVASRQDTSSARYIRRIAGVTVRNADGDTVFTCGDCTRDALTAQMNINQALAGRAEVRLPMPDARLISGTPGGYQAAVQKDALQIRADQALNNDSSFQVPGLEIVSINDDPSLRARQVVQLAGVAAATSYGIFQTGGGFGFAALDGQEQGPLPPGLDVVSTPESGTKVFESSTSGPPPVLGAGSSGGLPARLVRSVVHGAMLYIRNPREALLAATVWLALLAPLFAFARRRELVRSLTSQ
jgi:hypothetical protein